MPHLIINTKNISLSFTVEDNEHAYYLSICKQAEHASGINDSFVQMNKNTRKVIVIGRSNETDLEGTRIIIF